MPATVSVNTEPRAVRTERTREQVLGAGLGRTGRTAGTLLGTS